MSKYQQLLNVSNPDIVARKLHEYYPGTQLYVSTHRTKKYMIQTPTGSWSHFGDIRFSDYSFHKDEERRRRYLQRALHIKGNWKSNPYSSNLLSIRLLW
jgi:hypothetical protein